MELFHGIAFILTAGLKNRDKVKRQVEENGGVVKPRRTSENDVVLFDPGVIKDARGFNGMALDVRFVTNSIQAGVCERPADYTITPSDPVPLIYREQGRGRANPRSVAHHVYTDEDDMNIFRFLDKEIRIARSQGRQVRPAGMKVWQKAAREGVAPTHTLESMRTRFKNYIGPNMEEFARRLAAERQAEASAGRSAPAASEGPHSVGRPFQERRAAAGAVRTPGGAGTAATPYDSRRLSESFRSPREEEPGSLFERVEGSKMRSRLSSAGIVGKRSRQGGHRRDSADGGQTGGNGPLDETVYEEAEEPFDLSDTLFEENEEATQRGRMGGSNQCDDSTSSGYETIVCDTPPTSEEGGKARKRARTGEAGDASMVTAREGKSIHGRQQPGERISIHGRQQPGEGKSIHGRQQPGEGISIHGRQQPGERISIHGRQQPGERISIHGRQQPGEGTSSCGNRSGNYYGGADSMIPPDLIPDNRSSFTSSSSSSSPRSAERRQETAVFVAQSRRLMRWVEAMERKFNFEGQWVADILRWEGGAASKAVAVAEQLREMTDELHVPCSIVMKVYLRTGNVARTQEKVEGVMELHKRTGVRYDWIVLWMEMLDYDVAKTEKYLGNRYGCNDDHSHHHHHRRRERR